MDARARMRSWQDKGDNDNRLKIITPERMTRTTMKFRGLHGVGVGINVNVGVGVGVDVNVDVYVDVINELTSIILVKSRLKQVPRMRYHSVVSVQYDCT